MEYATSGISDYHVLQPLTQQSVKTETHAKGGTTTKTNGRKTGAGWQERASYTTKGYLSHRNMPPFAT